MDIDQGISSGRKNGYTPGMKIDGPGSSGKVSQAKKTTKTGGSGGVGFSNALREAEGEEGQLDGDDAVESAGSVGLGGAVGSIGALLALQGVDVVSETNADGRGRNRAALDRGEDLLERLDGIRHELLAGQLTRGRLVELQQALARRMDGMPDPKIKSLLDDIELRVAVELAKHDRTS